MRPFLPRKAPHKDDFVERYRLRDHPDDVVRARGFFTADYLRFPLDMTGISMYMNEHLRIYAFQIHSPSTPQLSTVDNIDPLNLEESWFLYSTDAQGPSHFPIHGPLEYVTKVTIRTLVPGQRTAVDLAVEVGELNNVYHIFNMLIHIDNYKLGSPCSIWIPPNGECTLYLQGVYRRRWPETRRPFDKSQVWSNPRYDLYKAETTQTKDINYATRPGATATSTASNQA